VSTQRLATSLNAALADLMRDDERLFLLGEDIADPYGGAFKVTRGLSTSYPDRVLSTPISESAIVGVASGLAMRGNRVIVEVMFGDFLALCFDQLVNFAAKSVSMYGQRLDMPIVVRCPVGGQRGYGPSHSQNLQKHFIGVPGLSLFEMTAFHDNRQVLGRMLRLGQPCVFFEDKALYAAPVHAGGVIDDVFGYDFLDADGEYARLFAGEPSPPDCLLIAPGGLVQRALAAMRTALLDRDVLSQLVVPSRLYPFDVAPLLPLVAQVGRVCVLEDGVAGGTWGREVAGLLHEACWGVLRAPVRLVSPDCRVIPAARHLEDQLAVSSARIHDEIVGLADA
jgi:pyruvate/2-oxoglutarate/acetoin dehydrogenase E1 component